MSNYMLYCGKHRYEVTPDIKNHLDGLMYWAFELELARAAGDGFAEQQAQDAIGSLFQEFEKLGVPNWVVNGAKAFGEKNDLRCHYLSEFYEKSVYAKPPKKQMER